MKVVTSSLLNTEGGGQRLIRECLGENGRSPHIQGQGTFNKFAENTQWRKVNLFNYCISTCRKIKFYHFIPYTKLTQDGTSVRSKTITLLEENMAGGSFLTLILAILFMVMTPK